MNITHRQYQRWSEDAATLSELRDLWRVKQDLGSLFTTAEQREQATKRFRYLLERS